MSVLEKLRKSLEAIAESDEPEAILLERGFSAEGAKVLAHSKGMRAARTLKQKQDENK